MTKYKQTARGEATVQATRRQPNAPSIILFCIALTIGVLVFNLTSPSAVAGPPKQQDFGLPDLHKINLVTLQPSYSCRPPDEFQKGYENTGLFLSKFSRDNHSPELLFNGDCHDADYFHDPSGDSMSLIADMGKIPIEDITAQLVLFTRDHHFDRRAMVRRRASTLPAAADGLVTMADGEGNRRGSDLHFCG